MFINIKLFIISFLNKVLLLSLNRVYLFSIQWLLVSASVLNGQISCDLCERTMRRAIRQPTGRENSQTVTLSTISTYILLWKLKLDLD